MILDYRYPRKFTSDRFWVVTEKELSDKPVELISQLLFWLQIQSYWYWVLDRPAFTDEEFDKIKLAFKQLLKKFPLETKDFADMNLYWGRTPCHFPESVKKIFNIEAFYSEKTSGPHLTPVEKEVWQREKVRLLRKQNCGFVFRKE